MTEKINRNRLANVTNGYQGKYKKVLCVCSAGVLRSPTTAWVLSNDPFNFNTRAVGVAKGYALIPIDVAHVAWADEIVVMEPDQKVMVEVVLEDLQLNYSSGFDMYTSEKPIHVLHVPDNYGYRDGILVNMITEKCREIFKTG